jgi:outer membrane autotransporter protein
MSVSIDEYDVSRDVELSTGTRTLTSRPDGFSYAADLEVGHRLQVGAVSFVPSLGVAYDRIERDAFSEDGDEIAALRFRGENRDAFIGRAGFRVSAVLGSVMPYAAASVSREFGDASTRIKPLLNGTEFAVEAPVAGRTAVRAGAGIAASLSQNVNLRVGYRFVGLGNSQSHGANAGVSVRF